MLYAYDKSERPFLALCFGGGIAIRLSWLATVGGSISGTYGSAEGSRVAYAVSQGVGVADAYYQGYGPTAHMMPVSPAIAGFLLWLFGPLTAASNIALLCWSLAQVGIAILLLRCLFTSLGASRPVIRWGTALLCIVTPFITQETIDFRYWDGAAALGLGTANLLLMSQFGGEPQPGWRKLAIIAALAAATLFVSPPVGFAVGLCWTVAGVRKLDLRRCVQLGILTFAAAALLFGPWALRNAHAFGEPVLMRSNFGLELAIANHAGALSDKPPELVHARRLAEIHPYQSTAGPRRLAPGQEVTYSRSLAKRTWTWIAANPASFAILYGRHLREFFFPDPWELYFSGWPGLAGTRAAVMSMVDLLGLAGLALGLARRRRGYWTIALFVTALSLPYGLFEPTTTHMYPAYSLLGFLAVEALASFAAAAGGWTALVQRLGRDVEQAEVG